MTSKRKGKEIETSVSGAGKKQAAVQTFNALNQEVSSNKVKIQHSFVYNLSGNQYPSVQCELGEVHSVMFLGSCVNRIWSRSPVVIFFFCPYHQNN